MNRRTYLAAVAGGLALAGCVGDEGDDSADADEDDSYQRLVEDEEFPPVSEPADVPSEPLCGVCNMTPADYPHANAQVVHENEARQFFCSPGCLTTYTVAPDAVAETDSPIATAWARDTNHEELVAAEDLYWVLDTNPDRGIDPMRNPLPYEEHDDALAWVEDHGNLAPADIVTTDEITVADVEEYRAFYME
ncbi:MAG: nitrous oxide reductase accessory protein NosL [Halorubrum sp.]